MRLGLELLDLLLDEGDLAAEVEVAGAQGLHGGGELGDLFGEAAGGVGGSPDAGGGFAGAEAAAFDCGGSVHQALLGFG